MKKKLAALLCGVMCLTGFSGCSDTELAYLQMSSGMLDMMDACEVRGTTQVDVDLDGMQDFLEDVVAATNNGGFAMLVPDGMSGQKSVTLDYTMQMNMNRLEYDMDLDLTYAGETYDMGTLYYSLTDGIYYSTDGILGLYDFADDILDADTKADAGYFFSDAYAADLQAALAQQKYIEIVSAEDLTGADMDEAMPQDGFGNLYDAAITFYQDVLQGFETGMVTKIDGGFAIQTDGQQAAELLVNLLDFIAANPEQILDAAEVYLTAVTEEMAMGAEEKAEMTALFTEARANEADFVDTVVGIREFVQVILEEESVQMLLDGFQYDATVKEKNGSYVSKENNTLTYDGKTIAKMTSAATVKKANVKLAAPKNAMTLDALQNRLAALEEKYNPVTGICVNWGWEDTNTEALIYAVRAQNEVFGATSYDAEWTDILMQDGRAYVPLRLVCDMLGEDIGWEKATKTAYVTVDGEKIELESVLQDGSSFVGVREFEKLGYTVDYSSAYGEKTAVIEK